MQKTTKLSLQDKIDFQTKQFNDQMDLAIADSLKDVNSTQEDSQSTKSDNLKGTGPQNLMLAKKYEP